MQKTESKKLEGSHPARVLSQSNWWPGIIAAACAIYPATQAYCDTTTTGTDDPLLNLFIQKGFVTQEEAIKVKAEADNLRTNTVTGMPATDSKWKIGSGVKNMELFGDVRLRYEARDATAPGGGSIDLNRLRYALRLGLRGQAFDDYYYGFRLETSSNPRSTWVTLGSNDGGSGAFSKSSGGVDIGQIYLGWHPESWFDLTVGKMPNPIYTTPMVWDSDISPEGAAERFKYTVGKADFYVTLGQFLYQDSNPTQTAPGYFGLGTSSGSLPFLFVWQGGMNFNFTKEINFKIEPALYQYNRFNNGQTPTTANPPNASDPDFYGTYVGQGSTYGVNGIPASYNQGGPFDGFYSNETGINNLLVLEIPFELDVKKFKSVDLSLFGDYAQNLQGSERAMAAYNAANSSYYSIANNGTLSPITSPQTHDDKAYQIGLAIASKDALGLTYGAATKKNAWELRTYWQHIEQYSLDPNLIDSDFFEGAENLQGIYVAFAYALSANMIGTVRYGHATRINDMLGTGSSDSDIPQMNPINTYNLFQVDFSFRF